MKNSNFRNWLHQIWYDHCNEFEAWFRKQPPYRSEEYFHVYKWWLKKEYRRRLKNGEEL